MPLRVIVCGVPVALSAMLIELLKPPRTVWLNIALIVQDFVGASGETHVLVSEKGALGFEILVITRDRDPVFSRVTDRVALVPTT